MNCKCYRCLIFIYQILVFFALSCLPFSQQSLLFATTTQPGSYRVKPHDTLYSIAWTFGLDYRVIAELNHLKKPYHLKVNQSLLLVETAHTARQGLGNPVVITKHVSLPTAHALSPVLPVKPLQPWIWPTTGHIISAYTPTGSPPNKGIDIAGKKGQSILAVTGGEVVYSGEGIPGYGHLIILKHNTHYLTAYAFNLNNLVKEGQYVKQGQIIAHMGTYHQGVAELHFEIRYNGRPINPMQYLPVKQTIASKHL